MTRPVDGPKRIDLHPRYDWCGCDRCKGRRSFVNTITVDPTGVMVAFTDDPLALPTS